MILQSYLDTVIHKDIADRYAVKDIYPLKLLANKIMTEFSRQFSVNKFYNFLKSLNIACSKDKIYSYLNYMEDSYLIYPVCEYSKSFASQTTSLKKNYIVDTGMIKAESFLNESDLGYLLENLVYITLRRDSFNEISYYLTNEKALNISREVDFFVRNKVTNSKRLIQVAWKIDSDETIKREVLSLKRAMAEQNLDSGIIITFDDERELDGNIKVIPAWKWLYEEK